jgi:hypothetical protein
MHDRFDFEAGEQKQKASPSGLMTWIGVSIETQPDTRGPITIPSTIPSTIAGSRILGKSPRASGAASAAAATISSPSNEIVGIARAQLRAAVPLTATRPLRRGR